MAKKTSASRTKKSKKAAGKVSKRSSASKKSAKSSTTKKTATRKTTKKTRGKAPAKKSTRKKSTRKKSTRKKTAAKKTAEKQPARRAAPKKAAGRKVTKVSERSPAKASAAKSDKPAASKSAAEAAREAAAAKGGRKGITIVPDKPRRPPRRSRPKAPETRRPVGSQLLGPGSPKRLPLIPSGPKAPKAEVLSQAAGEGKVKSPFKKRELDKFRTLLINKRRTLVGDVSQLETEALRNSSGGLSHTPQHMAEQGSDSADQSLSLGLAAADRRLIKEIDAALQRMDEGRFGICELSGRPIRAERLKELPWARYSIEAARHRERNMTRGNW